MKYYLKVIFMLIVILFLVACGGNVEQEELDIDVNEEIREVDIDTKNESTSLFENHEFYEKHTGNLDHIHGLGYAGNQNAIFFASHTGLKIFENGIWYKTKELNNDYMGFNAVDKGFYTSGHPGPGVNLPDPIGLKRSFDNGQTLENLGLEGESDFHAMGVGYESHTIIVLNEHANSLMDVGLYITKDAGQTWFEIKGENLGTEIFSISVHPTNDNFIAVAGKEGVFLSEDGGDSFTLITSNQQGTSVFFNEDALWYGTFSKEPLLTKFSLSNEEIIEITLPKMKNDAVKYFAQNPQNEREIVFSSFNGDIYLSNDTGETWITLVKQGKIQ